MVVFVVVVVVCYVVFFYLKPYHILFRLKCNSQKCYTLKLSETLFTDQYAKHILLQTKMSNAISGQNNTPFEVQYTRIAYK